MAGKSFREIGMAGEIDMFGATLTALSRVDYRLAEYGNGREPDSVFNHRHAESTYLFGHVVHQIFLCVIPAGRLA